MLAADALGNGEPVHVSLVFPPMAPMRRSSWRSMPRDLQFVVRGHRNAPREHLEARGAAAITRARETPLLARLQGRVLR